MKLTKGQWIWYPGDFEIYHGMLQNIEREERGFDWPAYWHIDNCRNNVSFKRNYELAEAEEIYVEAEGVGYVIINEVKYPLAEKITCEKGFNEIIIFVANPRGLPAIHVTGNEVYSDKKWIADDFITSAPVGTSSLYLEVGTKPNSIYFTKEATLPIEERSINEGVLFDFGKTITGTVLVDFIKTKNSVTLCYGESEVEALDTEMCYYKQTSVSETSDIRKRAFRYIFIPNINQGDLALTGIHEYIPLEVKGRFETSDSLLNRVWEISERTFKLCSNMFFIDGIKRDRWIWSGDAYQSYFINQYLFFDEEINQRTMLALRGQNEVKQHINTIVDYSLLWLIGVENHYDMTGDAEFVAMIYPKMESMMNHISGQIDEHGFIYGRKDDWIFVDWADMDKDGTVCAEQLLLLRAYETMIHCGQILNLEVRKYKNSQRILSQNIEKFFWNKEKGAFIDSYQSGKNNVTRHANIFAIIFDLVDKDKQESIVENVLFNEDVTQITTPYFKFYELDALGKLGYFEQVINNIKEYWGGMLENNANTFWEEYNPLELGNEKYSMYGDPYGKSLCHAWGASPIYLLSRYFIGLVPTKPGYKEFLVEPQLEYFDSLNCTLPLKDGELNVVYADGELTVSSSISGGVLSIDGNKYQLPEAKPIKIKLSK